MKELESYSIDELEQLTDSNRRTISYYIAEGLLPKVGRRGPKTRYGREFVDRLKFIQHVKAMQYAGKLPTVTLSDIGVIMSRLSDEDIVEGGRSQKRLLEIFAEGLAEDFNAAEPANVESDAAVDSFDFDEPDVSSAMTWGSVDSAPESRPKSPRMVRASSRRDMYEHRARSSPVQEPDAMYSALSMREEPEASAGDMFDEPLSATRADAERSMEQIAGVHREVGAVAEDIASLRTQLRQIREETRTDLQDMHSLAREVTELRHLVRTEVNGLRESLDELTTLRKRNAPENHQTRQARLRNRARMWARRTNLPNHLMRVAELRTNPEQPGRLVWEFPVDPKMLAMNADMTLLLERRAADGADDGFIALQVPLHELAEAVAPMRKQMKAPLRTCRVSAEPDDYLRGINIPGLDLRRYVQETETG